jgi:hypothetical protein
MTQDEIIEMAKAAGFMTLSINEDKWVPYLERFAKLVAQHEREACAKVCEDLDAWNMDDPASTAATAIRARGQA